MEKQQHTMMIIDFIQVSSRSCHVIIAGVDADTGREFNGEVRFTNGMLNGDVIHPERTVLSPGCREFVENKLYGKYKAGDFS
ncbi:hypothetical protein [Bacillus massiliglaciei]|uniref:hypothetical protein n=1 Tax=Bacillus massiliglaciei TaxID=1816693 RepID=UPI000DA5FFF5|nr:hypothetical protein [Bacillus massiliglaciei]